MARSAKSPARLTPPFFHLMLSMSREPKHGYTMMSEVAERTRGRIRMGPSTLYYSLGRLEDLGLIHETEALRCHDDAPHEERRKYYALTPEGRERLKVETEILEYIVGHARTLDVIG